MTDSKFKLSYFNMRGLGESIRYIFAYADVAFEDNRITHADWPAIKENYEYQQLPVLEVDGKSINQSVAIVRYLGKRFGLVASDPLTDALLEALTDNLRDVQAKFRESIMKKTPESVKEAGEAVEFFLKKVEPLAAGGFFYGGKSATWTDIYFFAISELMSKYLPDTLKPFPNLTALTNKIRSKESVKKYIAVRPEDN